MTANAGAPVDNAVNWRSIDWAQAHREVRRLQMRIAKAVNEGRWNRVRSLQYLFSHSFYAKLMAVKRVTSNKGRRSPGVDGVLWQGSRAKWRAACSLRRRGYKPQPLRRIYILKKNGKKRPLSIPMYDRAMQALYKLTLLAERGLSLSQEKTVITHIKHGFTFLGQTFHKHGGVLHITPAKEGVLALIRKVGTLTRTYVSALMLILATLLNQALRGWGNYHRHVVASEAFSRIDGYVYEQLWRMLRQRHPNKSKEWLAKRYWSTPGENSVFSVISKTAKGMRLYKVARLCSMHIQRYVKIKADANPYMPEYAAYFWQRRHKKESRLLPAMSARQLRAMAL